METDFCVYIGRFQPPTIVHIQTIKQALKEANKVIIIIGSDEVAPSLKNPFSTKERIEMIQNCFPQANNQLIFQPIQDSAYNFNDWVKNVQEAVSYHVSYTSLNGPQAKIKIIGHLKDASSYYLKYFPQWEFISVPELYKGLSATSIREALYRGKDFNANVFTPVAEYIYKLKSQFSERFALLSKEYNFIEEYKAKWSSSPFPPIFVTTDCVVMCLGHILMVIRGQNPGKGLYALPGGFLNQNELIEDCALRELKEETKIDVALPILRNSIKQIKVIDAIDRDPRGRTITHVHFINLNFNELPNIKGSDDAAEAVWLPISEVDEMRGDFFNDHWAICKYFLNQI